MTRGPKPIARLPRVHVFSGVPKYAAEAVRKAVRRAAAVMAVRHRLTVHVVPAPVVIEPHWDAAGFGCFMSGSGRIYIGGLSPSVFRLQGATHTEAVFGIAETVFHELVHYEQWRDGKPMNHRGLQQRVNALMRETGYAPSQL